MNRQPPLLIIPPIPKAERAFLSFLFSLSIYTTTASFLYVSPLTLPTKKPKPYDAGCCKICAAKDLISALYWGKCRPNNDEDFCWDGQQDKPGAVVVELSAGDDVIDTSDLARGRDNMYHDAKPYGDGALSPCRIWCFRPLIYY